MGYTRNELKPKQDPLAALALAVARQWALDGRPKHEEQGAKVWRDMYSQCISTTPKRK